MAQERGRKHADQPSAPLCPVGTSEAGAGGPTGRWKLEPAMGCHYRGLTGRNRASKPLLSPLPSSQFLQAAGPTGRAVGSGRSRRVQPCEQTAGPRGQAWAGLTGERPAPPATDCWVIKGTYIQSFVLTSVAHTLKRKFS